MWTFCFEIEKAIKNKIESKFQKRNSDKNKSQSAPLEATVRVQIPDVDFGRGDSRNLLAVVMNITEDGFRRLGTVRRILKHLYVRSECTVCPNDLMKMGDVPGHEKALRSTASQSC